MSVVAVNVAIYVWGILRHFTKIIKQKSNCLGWYNDLTTCFCLASVKSYVDLIFKCHGMVISFIHSIPWKMSLMKVVLLYLIGSSCIRWNQLQKIYRLVIKTCSSLNRKVKIAHPLNSYWKGCSGWLADIYKLTSPASTSPTF